MMRARAPRIWCMAYAAVKKVLTNCDTPPKSIVTATALGALDETKNYLDGVFKDGFGSPRNFIASVHNSMAGKLALDFKIKGPNLTVCDGQNSFASACVTASLLTARDYPVLIVAVDERIALLDTIAPSISDACRKYYNPAWEEAAVAFLCNSSSKEQKPSIQATGPTLINTLSPEQKCSELAQQMGSDTGSLPPLTQTSDSFIKSAIAAYETLQKNQTGPHCIGSYSPSSLAAAVIKICV